MNEATRKAPWLKIRIGVFVELDGERAVACVIGQGLGSVIIHVELIAGIVPG